MKTNHLIRKSLLVVLLFVVANGFAQDVTVDFATTYQTIDGFGGCNYPTWIPDLNENSREKCFSNEPWNMGLSVLRIHIDPDSTSFKRELPTANYATKQGVKIFATPWYAPNHVTDGSVNPSRVDPAKYGLYADYLNQFDDFMKNNGSPLYAISIQNEPDYGNSWSRWTSAEMVNFLKNYGGKLKNSRVMAPESFQFVKSFSDAILNDPDAEKQIEIVGAHIYGSGLTDYPLARTKGKQVWETEHTVGDNTNANWAMGITFARELQDCMVANYNAYVYWYLLQGFGMIDLAGNITDKGYILAQYSKFVRPGAVRIAATAYPVSDVWITAYKTDTSFDMVVINKSAKAQNLNITFANGTVTKLTKFTTTATKRIVNDGDIIVSANPCVLSVDASSVTTFTTHPQNGGKQGNVKPVAVAGADLNLINPTGEDVVTFTLDGSASSDSDGTIKSYSWSLDGVHLGGGSTYNASLNSAGVYKYSLTVTDNDGATSTDQVIVTITSPLNTEIWLEAEKGTVGKVWNKVSDTNASGGMYVTTPSGVQRNFSASNKPDSIVVLNFNTTQGGIYKVWARITAPSANDDSFWYKVDNQEWVSWNSIPEGSSFHWAPFHIGTASTVAEYTLAAGSHTVSFCMREDGCNLDKVLISNTGMTPTGLGGSSTGIDVINSDLSTISVSPNPSTGNVSIKCNDGFNSLNVFNQVGQLVYTENFNIQLQQRNVNLNLKPGIYIISLQGNRKSGVSKLIIE